jgi:hypothetical protein
VAASEFTKSLLTRPITCAIAGVLSWLPQSENMNDTLSEHHRFRDNCALVTGANSGIGAAAALALAEAGAKVRLNLRGGKDSAELLVAQIRCVVPGVWCVGSVMNRYGGSVQVLQMYS